jgi:hypothetical protein
MWINKEFPSLLEEQIELTLDEKCENVLEHLRMKPLFRLSDYLQSMGDSDPVLDIFKMSEVGFGLMMKRMMPIYEMTKFFDEHFPKYDYKDGIVKEIMGQSVTNTVMDNPESYGRKDLTLEEIFGIDEDEGKSDEQRGKEIEFEEACIEDDGAEP